MGAHVSAVPNHQVSRVTGMKMRGDVALGGNFGYELDLSAQTEEDTEEIRRQVKLVKRIRETTQRGVFTRLLSPFDGNVAAWQFVDENRVVLCVYRILAKPNPAPIRIRLRDVPDGIYHTEDGNKESANTLMNVGVCPVFPKGDFASCVLVFEKG
jgi:alpha-galactosidase